MALYPTEVAVFLGAGLFGLTRREIEKQFDAIVDFSGVEKFLDTLFKNKSDLIAIQPVLREFTPQFDGRVQFAEHDAVLTSTDVISYSLRYTAVSTGKLILDLDKVSAERTIETTFGGAVNVSHVVIQPLSKDKVRLIIRGQGLGELLLSEAIDLAIENRQDSVTLEVRKSNYLAQQLYEKYRFLKVGVRKRYYSDNHEDALIMTTPNILTSEYRALYNQHREQLLTRLGGTPAGFGM